MYLSQKDIKIVTKFTGRNWVVINILFAFIFCLLLFISIGHIHRADQIAKSEGITLSKVTSLAFENIPRDPCFSSRTLHALGNIDTAIFELSILIFSIFIVIVNWSHHFFYARMIDIFRKYGEIPSNELKK